MHLPQKCCPNQLVMYAWCKRTHSPPKLIVMLGTKIMAGDNYAVTCLACSLIDRSGRLRPTTTSLLSANSKPLFYLCTKCDRCTQHCPLTMQTCADMVLAAMSSFIEHGDKFYFYRSILIHCEFGFFPRPFPRFCVRSRSQ